MADMSSRNQVTGEEGSLVREEQKGDRWRGSERQPKCTGLSSWWVSVSC